MCLDLKNFAFKRTAIKDIIVYKELLSYEHNNEINYVTPYQNSEVYIGGTYTSSLERSGNTVNRGLHSFVNPLDVFENSPNITKCIVKWIMVGEGKKELCSFDTKPVLVKCRIPKGSHYYVGVFDSYRKFKSIASDALIYDGIIGFY